MAERCSTGIETLLPCPLCQAEAYTLMRGFCFIEGQYGREDAVRCPTCGCRATFKSWQARHASLDATQDEDEIDASGAPHSGIRGGAQGAADCDSTGHIDWDIMAEERLGQRPLAVKSEPWAYYIEHPMYGVELSLDQPSERAIENGWTGTPLYAAPQPASTPANFVTIPTNLAQRLRDHLQQADSFVWLDEIQMLDAALPSTETDPFERRGTDAAVYAGVNPTCQCEPLTRYTDAPHDPGCPLSSTDREGA